MVKQLKILFYCFNAYGHMNPCIGVAELLRERGHQISFVVGRDWSGKLAKYGFNEIPMDVDEPPDDDSEPGRAYTDLLKSKGFFDEASSYDKLGLIQDSPVLDQRPDPLIKEVIQNYKPDLIVVAFLLQPSIVKTGIPWVNLCPANPLMMLFHEKTPPSWSGLPSNDPSSWTEFRNRFNEVFSDINEQINRKFAEEGAESCTSKDIFLNSPYLNIYAYPEEIDYLDLRPLPDKWHRFDSFIRSKDDADDIEIPDRLKNGNGKLIYFSMGSMGSCNVPLMKKLTAYLANIPHRFIVSKGINGDEFELPNNCYGKKIVPQTKVLQMVDAVVTHGGNNSIAETINYGKPMVVMPIFADQYDNAQRVHEKEFGVRLDPYKCQQEELTEAVERIVGDEQMRVRVKKASERIRRDEKANREKLVKLVEGLVKK